MANIAIPHKTLRLGVDEALYVGTGGAINATGTAGTSPNGTFAIPPQCSNYRGMVWFQAVPVGGTVTALTFQVETSLDGGTTFGILTRTFGVTGAPSTLTTYSALAFGTLASAGVIGVDFSGLGGNGCLRLNFTTVTLGTGTGANIFAHMG